MILADVTVYLIISLAVAQMYSYSTIFIPVRNLIARIPYIRKPLLCPECSSFWMGVFTSFFFNPFLNCFDQYNIISTAVCGLITHLFAVYLYKIYYKLQS